MLKWYYIIYKCKNFDERRVPVSTFNNKITRITSLVFAIIIVVGILLSTTSTASAAESGSDYDFSRPTSGAATVISGADLLELYLGESISDGEAGYLAEHSSVTLKYTDSITTAYVLTSYENGALTVTARPYSYTAENGVLVTWIPTSATT